MKNIYFILVVFFLVIGCKKYKAKKYSGIYKCVVNYHLFEIGGISIDSTYQESVLIEYENESIIIFNKIIPADSLKKNDFFFVGHLSDYYEIKIIKDSLYYNTYSGGQGGNGSLNYAGVKE